MSKTIDKTIFLQGMCFSGKTTTGKYLSKKLGIDFLDSREIFYNIHNEYDLDYLSQYGNERFCDAEKNSFLQNFGMKVVALSGSALYYEDVMTKLRNEHIVIWLNVSYDSILDRKKKEESDGIIRPIVYPDGILNFKDLYDTRTKLYQKYATITIDIEYNDSIENILKKILLKLNR